MCRRCTRPATSRGRKETFHGYIPSEQGYPFLREAIQRYYAGRGVALDTAEIFISDGAKSDLGNLLDLFDVDNTVLVPDPVYPVYVDDNVMAGRRITYMPASAENHFLPMPDENTKADIVYLCSPNNPTGATYTRSQLKVWVDWANAHDAVILFDAAYECFVSEEGLARSIYEVEGAKTCAIEVCSFSKIAGFTGNTRSSVQALARDGMNLNKMWLRRQTTKFNGVAYTCGSARPPPCSARDGMREIQQNLDYYRRNAAVIAAALDEAACGTAAARTARISGLNARPAWAAGSSLTGCWTPPTLSARRAKVLAGAAKGISRLTAFGDAERTKEGPPRASCRAQDAGLNARAAAGSFFGRDQDETPMKRSCSF